MRKLLSVGLAVLCAGTWAMAERPARAASYAGAASMRSSPVPQDCDGHIEYQLQRTTVLQPVSETVYETQVVPTVQEVAETIYQPRTVTTMRNVVERGVRDVPYTVQRPVYRTVMTQVPYTV
ncbi:MAG: hypothetical protein KGM43_05925, partial [Planctomycetota bacterium]|nr:hypothetical protein [Planctomycetota bacterium]